MNKYVQMVLKWLAAVGSGGLAAFGAYVLSALQAIPVDLSKTDGLVLAVVVSLAVKAVSWVVAKIPAPQA